MKSKHSIKFLILIRLVTAVDCTFSPTFEVADPVIWYETPYSVIRSSDYFFIKLTILNPCQGISKLKDVESSEYRNATLEILQQRCEQILAEEWLPTFNSVPVKKRIANDTVSVVRLAARKGEGVTIVQVKESEMKKIRRKRVAWLAVFPALKSVGVSFSAGAMGSAFTNMITSVWDSYYPNSQYNRLGRAETNIESHQKMFGEIKYDLNVSRTVEVKLTEKFETLTTQLYNQDKNINEASKLMSEVAIIVFKLGSCIKSRAQQLRTILDTAKHSSRIEISELSHLFETDVFKAIDSKNTMVRSIERSDNTIEFTFYALTASNTTYVLKTSTFDYWSNYSGDPNLNRYIGADYLIFNNETNCAKAIDQPQHSFVHDECLRTNYLDPELNKWTKVQSNPFKDSNIVSRPKLTIEGYYVYCWPRDIIISEIRTQCPSYPFRIPSGMSFTLDGTHYEAKNSHEFHELSTPNLSFRANRYGSLIEDINTTAVVREMLILRKIIRDNPTFTVTELVRDGLSWTIELIAMVVLVGSIGVVLVILCLYLYPRPRLLPGEVRYINRTRITQV